LGTITNVTRTRPGFDGLLGGLLNGLSAKNIREFFQLDENDFMHGGSNSLISGATYACNAVIKSVLNAFDIDTALESNNLLNALPRLK